MKNIIIAAAILFLIVFTRPVSAKTVFKESINGYSLRITQVGRTVTVRWNGRVYRRYYNFTGKVKVVPARKLGYNRRTHRKNKYLYVERVIGVITDNSYNGRIINGLDDNFDYISYKTLRPYARKGDMIVSYFIYNPFTNYFDDIDDRFDIILG